MKTRWPLVVSMVSVLAWTAPVIAEKGRGQGNGHGNGRGKAKVEKSERAEKRKVAEPAIVIDRDGHRRIVTQYYSHESLPPGLARRQSLPPGLQKQLRERGRLPPGLQKRLVPVPGPLVSQLPRVSSYYNRYFAGRDLIVVDRRTNAIVAVIPDVMAPRR